MKFISASSSRHAPEIPSAEEVETGGYLGLLSQPI